MKTLAELAGDLVAIGMDEAAALEDLRRELTSALASEDWQVNRRETPFVSSQTPMSVPAWAAGRQIARTAGPFQDNLGRPFWFDFYNINKQMKVARQGTSAPFLSLPIDDNFRFSKVKAKVNLNAGSLWLVANHLSFGAPANTFTGLTLESGSITFSGSYSIQGDTILIGQNDTVRLELKLAQPSVGADATTRTGDDAKAMDCALPQKLVLECSPGVARFSEFDQAKLSVYGSTYRLTQASRPNRFEPLTNRILIRLENDQGALQVSSCASPFIALDRSAPLSESAWALSVTQASSMDQLGGAAGIGAIALIADSGLWVTWKGLEKSPVQLGHVYLLAQPGRIAITAPLALARGNRQRFELWPLPQHPDTPIHSRVTLHYPKQFAILYNCLAAGSETLLMADLEATLSIDRPVTADGGKPFVETDRAKFLLFRIKDVQYAYLLATQILERLLQLKRVDRLSPIAFALSNALIKTTPVDDFILLGIVRQDRLIEQGALRLVTHVYQLVPSLPDPYVSSYIPPINREYTHSPLYGGATSGIDLVALTRWENPKRPETSLALSLPPTAQGQAIRSLYPESSLPPSDDPTTGPASSASAARTYSYRANRSKVPQEDAEASQALLDYFERAFGAIARSNIFLLDVSTNADLLGVGLGTHFRQDRVEQQPFAGLPFGIKGMDLVTQAINSKVYTLPQIQWEPVRTVQNPDTRPYPFPSPATSPDTGIPTLIGVESYDLVPIAPLPVVNKFLSAYNNRTSPARAVGLFNLPFGMKAAALWDNAHNPNLPGASLALNRPVFESARATGGVQIAVIASSPEVGDQFETPGFKGATIQTRNLIDLLSGVIPLDDDGNPLSVLGPVVDTIFNAEFKPSGANPRVPVQRMDISGYGASLFSNWLNPNALIAATSQAKFDVWIGRTAHEIIQVKSILYPWAVPVVRTITIQRTSGGGVNRFDSGWKAQGPGNYDFSYFTQVGSVRTKVANPFEFHPGAVKGIDHVTGIRDTGRTYRQAGAVPTDDVIMQEVFFDTDVAIEDVTTGATGGYVPSRGQRGFVQLAPYQKPLTPAQFFALLQEEGALGGPVDCTVNVGLSGQTMRVLRVDVSGVDTTGGSYVFVSTSHGSVKLPREGSWSLVKRQENASDIITIDQDSGLPVIREGRLDTATSKPYRFSDPTDILREANPATDYGLLHSMGTQKVLYLRPTIARGDPNIRSTLQPHLADSFAIVNSKGIFPEVNTTFPLGGVGGAVLEIIEAGKLRLTSGGSYKASPGTTRDMLSSGTSRMYIDYSDARGSGDTSEFEYAFDSDVPVPWMAHSKNHSLVVDLGGFNSLISVNTASDAAYGKTPSMPNPKTSFGAILQPIVDMLSFLGGQDISRALAVSMGNLNSESWQPKLQGILEIEIEFKTFATQPPKFEVKIAHSGLDGEPPIPIHTPDPEPLPVLSLGCNIALKAYFNMAPQSLTLTHRDGSPATSEEIATASADMISTGVKLEIEGELHILVYTITPNVAGIYFVGILGFEFGLDSHEGKSFGFKVAVGLEIKAQWPVVGEVSVMMAIGLEMEWSDSGSGIYALMIFKGEAELLGGIIVVGIGIEAKGGQLKETNADGVDETYAICEVEFAVEVSLAFVIHFEFDETWQEKRQTA